MVLAAKMDELGKPAWIAALVFGFWWFWPVGLAVLAFLIGSGRMQAWRQEKIGRWYNTGGQTGGRAGGCGWRGRAQGAASSGNHAFDEYRAETLRRLEEEQKEFVDYLDRLRRAKDKAEFDQFMADRRARATAPEEPSAA